MFEGCFINCPEPLPCKRNSYKCSCEWPCKRHSYKCSCETPVWAKCLWNKTSVCVCVTGPPEPSLHRRVCFAQSFLRCHQAVPVAVEVISSWNDVRWKLSSATLTGVPRPSMVPLTQTPLKFKTWFQIFIIKSISLLFTIFWNLLPQECLGIFVTAFVWRFQRNNRLKFFSPHSLVLKKCRKFGKN